MRSSSSEELLETIERSLEPPLAIVGLGNKLKGDDGVGVYIAEKLKNLGHANIILAYSSLESYAYKLVELNSKTIVLIDAIEAGLEPGSIVFGDAKSIVNEISPVTTHTIPLPLIMKIVENELKRHVKWLIIGIQVRDTTIGKPMSIEVIRSADILINVLHNILTRLSLKS